MDRRSRRPLARVLVAVLFATSVLVACSSSGGDSSSIEGTYRHREEGTVRIRADHQAVFAQSGHASTVRWTMKGKTITFSKNGTTIHAEWLGDRLVFEEGAYSQPGKVTFTKD